MLNDDGIINKYLPKLAEEGNAGATFVAMYCEIFSLPYNASLIPEFTRMQNVYGKKCLFNSIIKLVTVSDLNHTNIKRLLYYFNNEYYSAKSDIIRDDGLTKDIDVLSKAIDKAKKSKIVFRSPLDD
jgi:hypothetical protein